MTSYFKGTDNGVNPIHRGINVPKRPFRITINILYGRIGDIYGAFGVLSVFLGIHVSLREPFFGSNLVSNLRSIQSY